MLPLHQIARYNPLNKNRGEEEEDKEKQKKHTNKIEMYDNNMKLMLWSETDALFVACHSLNAERRYKTHCLRHYLI
jgi:hypothetical protein